MLIECNLIIRWSVLSLVESRIILQIARTVGYPNVVMIEASVSESLFFLLEGPLFCELYAFYLFGGGMLAFRSWLQRR